MFTDDDYNEIFGPMNPYYLNYPTLKVCDQTLEASEKSTAETKNEANPPASAEASTKVDDQLLAIALQINTKLASLLNDNLMQIMRDLTSYHANIDEVVAKPNRLEAAILVKDSFYEPVSIMLLNLCNNYHLIMSKALNNPYASMLERTIHHNKQLFQILAIYLDAKTQLRRQALAWVGLHSNAFSGYLETEIKDSNEDKKTATETQTDKHSREGNKTVNHSYPGVKSPIGKTKKKSPANLFTNYTINAFQKKVEPDNSYKDYTMGYFANPAFKKNG